MAQVLPIVNPETFWSLGNDPLLQDFKPSNKSTKE